MRRLVPVLIISAAVVAIPAAARAQTPVVTPATPLARFFTDLLAAAARIDSTQSTERSDFIVASQLGTTAAQLNQSLGLQLATFPFDVGLDAPRPGAEYVPGHAGFAPAFAMHVGGIGARKVSFSFTYQNTSFGSLDGTALDSNQIGFVFKPTATLQPQFGRDVLHESVSLRMQQDAATFGIVYGATDRIDIGVAIPIVHVELEGTVQSQVYRSVGASASDRYFFDVYPSTPLASDGCAVTSIDVPGINRSGLGTVTQPIAAPFDMVELNSRTVSRRCAASGIGDVALHSKIRVAGADRSALAASVDVRLPTGNADQLLGTGTTRATAALVWSGRSGRFGPHANVGYTRSFGNGTALFNTVSDSASVPQPLSLKVPDEFDIAGGTDISIFRRVTAGLDVFGRRFANLERFRVENTTASALTAGDPQVPGTLLVNDGSGATLIVGVASGQVALTDRTLIKGDVLFPLFGSGLKPRVGAAVGLGFRY